MRGPHPFAVLGFSMHKVFPRTLGKSSSCRQHRQRPHVRSCPQLQKKLPPSVKIVGTSMDRYHGASTAPTCSLTLATSPSRRSGFLLSHRATTRSSVTCAQLVREPSPDFRQRHVENFRLFLQLATEPASTSGQLEREHAPPLLPSPPPSHPTNEHGCYSVTTASRIQVRYFRCLRVRNRRVIVCASN